ncbi:MAG: S1 RNA-binding domain-containing protein [Gemmatimonadetes bacterium]|nr:S1 RNA-binding domain-containing protein [Gemmatimonadota bacterium]MYD25526.1 S1 RNA-binding domain-containing protein [Gemmatimonadota bacterium]
MSDETHITKISGELGIRPEQVEAVARLLDEEATVPFIARYRKERTGSLDEVAVTAIRDRIGQLRELEKRRTSILASLKDRALLTDELESKVRAAETLTVLEDTYLPYRPKRRTRATAARERGLEPLAKRIFEQGEMDLEAEAAPFVDPEKKVDTAEDALSGARDIIAEWINEDTTARSALRRLFQEKAVIRSTVVAEKESSGIKFRDYFDWSETAVKAPSHRVLAMRRGEKEDVLRMTIAPPEGEAIARLEELFVKGEGPASEQVRLAVTDGYRRLLSLSLETELRSLVRQKAEQEATLVFARNLRELLMAPPLGRRRIMAVDPGFRTGCKVVCLDEQGKLMDRASIFPHSGDKKKERAARIVRTLHEQYEFDAIAVGNGTAGRETTQFLRTIGLAGDPSIVLVNESGASVYSASAEARQEFPRLDVTVRGAISIGRRLMDPLAELVKIDPKSIGVGQYQHDVDQAALKKSLDDVVTSCVNNVGVEVNTASAQLLSYVSGIGPALAKHIVAHREKAGPFVSRTDLQQVPNLGPRAFEQAAGFLRIGNAENPLDASAVHPESYEIVDRMASDQSCSVKELMDDSAVRGRIELDTYVNDTVGLPTLEDILEELARPGRDPREEFKPVQYTEGVNSIDEVKEGMRLNGVVTNVTNFGAFVDVGVHLDGLVHISQLVDRYVKHAGEAVKVGQLVEVRVLGVDHERNRISLSMREGKERGNGKPERRRRRRPSKRRQDGQTDGGNVKAAERTSADGQAEATEKGDPSVKADSTSKAQDAGKTEASGKVVSRKNRRKKPSNRKSTGQRSSSANKVLTVDHLLKLNRKL